MVAGINEEKAAPDSPSAPDAGITPVQESTDVVGLTITGYLGVRFGISVVLLTAAGAKIWELFAGVPPAGEAWDWLHVAHIQGEVFLGAWLILGVYARGAWWAAIFCFSLYAAFAGYGLVSGIESCGCLGQVRLSPWIPFTFDLAVIGTLLRSRGGFVGDKRWDSFRVEVIATFLIAAVAAGIFASAGLQRWERKARSVFGETAPGSVVVLRPETWIGRECPLLPFLDGRDDISVGEWRILLYYNDCEKCRRLVRASMMLSPSSGPRLCLVELSPTWEPLTGEIPAHVKQARLHRSRNWFVEAPAEIVLSNGVVVYGKSRTGQEQ